MGTRPSRTHRSPRVTTTDSGKNSQKERKSREAVEKGIHGGSTRKTSALGVLAGPARRESKEYPPPARTATPV